MSENVYDKARAVLAERGWRQGAPAWDGPEVCILGACAVAIGTNAYGWAALSRDRPEVVDALAEVIREQFPDSRALVGAKAFIPWKWNDDRTTTADDVDLVLDKAARAWDERVQP